MVRFLRNERRETGNVIIPSAGNLNFAFSPLFFHSIAKYRRRPIFLSRSDVTLYLIDDSLGERESGIRRTRKTPVPRRVG